jgi:transposase
MARARTRRQFSAEFKREAAHLAQRPGVSKAQVAKELGVDPGVLRRWVQQFESGAWETVAGATLKSSQTQEVERLRRELNRVKMERDILKKALAYFAKEPS